MSSFTALHIDHRAHVSQNLWSPMCRQQVLIHPTLYCCGWTLFLLQQLRLWREPFCQQPLFCAVPFRRCSFYHLGLPWRYCLTPLSVGLRLLTWLGTASTFISPTFDYSTSILWGPLASPTSRRKSFLKNSLLIVC